MSAVTPSGRSVMFGDQVTAAGLVPIFSGFLKGLDKVRVGVLKHLCDFLKSREGCRLSGLPAGCRGTQLAWALGPWMAAVLLLSCRGNMTRI